MLSGDGCGPKSVIFLDLLAETKKGQSALCRTLRKVRHGIPVRVEMFHDKPISWYHQKSCAKRRVYGYGLGALGLRSGFWPNTGHHHLTRATSI